MNQEQATKMITSYNFWRGETPPTKKEIKACIKAGADLSKFVRVSAIDIPYTITAMAAQSCPDALEDLVKAGADVNQQDPQGQAAIHIAAEYSAVSPKTFQKLIDLGADIHKESQLGDAYDKCLYGGCANLNGFKKLEILVNNGVDPNKPGKNGGLPLLQVASEAMKAFDVKDKQLIRPEAKETLNIKDRDVYAFREVARMLEFLIKNGADIYKKTKYGYEGEESFYSLLGPHIPFVAEMADFLSTHKKEEISEFVEKRLKSDKEYWRRRWTKYSKFLKTDYSEIRKEEATQLRKILFDSSEKNHSKRLEKAKDKAMIYHVDTKGVEWIPDPSNPEKELRIPLNPIVERSDPRFYRNDFEQTALKFKVKDKER
ncbi:MAG: ankyrin repeat domain-containing protein [Alphaproteobacteria bacterium]